MHDTALPTYKPKDFASDQDVRWCPGCGDYAVLKAVQKTLPELHRRREDFVFISGIGCAARFPYYMNTYGMHSIHGRAPAFATGVKLANPELQVWIVSGDGDLLSIGGNHTLHMMRRNLDVNVLLLNNRIYGLTKGQYSPTSEHGKTTKSTPLGSPDYPVNPLSLAIGASCTFVARTIDVDVKHLDVLMQAAAEHIGTSFIEVYQDCNIFNHKAWFYASQKNTRPDSTIMLEHGRPMIFGADNDKALSLIDGRIQVVPADDSDVLVHDETNLGMAFLLTQLSHPQFPEPLGILYRDASRESYDHIVTEQRQAAKTKAGDVDLRELIESGDVWTVD